MKINFQSAKVFRLPCYDIAFPALPQPFQQTDTKWAGPAGNIQLIKTDLQDCSIALINYKLGKPVTIKAHLDEFVYQVSFTSSPIESCTEESLVILSKINTTKIDLPALTGQLLFIHYTAGYFNKDGFLSELHQLLENTSSEKNPISLTAAGFSVLQQIISSTTVNKIPYLESKVTELLPLLCSSVQQGKNITSLSGKEIEMLLKIKEIISADISQPHTKFSLSKIVGGDAYSLSKNFKKWFGVSLRQYIHISRMQKARDLLRHSDLAIKKISFTVGYKNVSNFSESFKEYYGYSPSHLRESGSNSGNP